MPLPRLSASHTVRIKLSPIVLSHQLHGSWQPPSLQPPSPQWVANRSSGWRRASGPALPARVPPPLSRRWRLRLWLTRISSPPLGRLRQVCTSSSLVQKRPKYDNGILVLFFDKITFCSTRRHQENKMLTITSWKILACKTLVKFSSSYVTKKCLPLFEGE